MDEMRSTLISVLVDKRVKAIKRGNLAKAYDLTRWIKYVDHKASNREIAEYFIQYWNSTHNQNRLKQLPLFNL